MAVEKPGKLREFFFSYFVATLSASNRTLVVVCCSSSSGCRHGNGCHGSSMLWSQEALSRLHKFACESIFEIKVAGRFTSNLVRAAVKVRPDVALSKFLPRLCQAIIGRASGTMSRLCSPCQL